MNCSLIVVLMPLVAMPPSGTDLRQVLIWLFCCVKGFIQNSEGL